MARPPRESHCRSQWCDVVLILVFFSVCLVGILNHEMWRDEIYTWSIATNSHNLTELWANRAYEGHPITWLFAVYLVSQLTQDPFWMQMLHLTLATLTVSVFVFYAPFGRLAKILFTLSYFPLMEYGVITRNYGLGMLFAFCFCAACRRPNKLIAFLFLCCMVNTNVYAAMTAVALATIPVLQGWMGPAREEGKLRTDLAVGIAALGVATCLSFFQMKPPTSLGFQIEWDRLLDLPRVISSLTAVWNAYLPFPDVYSSSFWNVNIWHRCYAMWGSPVALVVVSIALVILATTVTCLLRVPIVALCYILGNVGILAFISVLGPGQLRHHGYLFVLFVACCWIAEQNPDNSGRLRHSGAARISSWIQAHRGTLVTILFAVQAVASFYILAQDISRPWSCVPEAAAWIDKHAERQIIAVYPGFVGNGIRVYSRARETFLLEKDGWGTIGFQDVRAHEDLTCEKMMARLVEMIRKTKKPVVLACNEQVKCVRQDLELTLVRAFEGCIRDDERVYLYRCALRQ